MSESLERAFEIELERVAAAGLRRSLVAAAGRDFTSNDYLCLARHPRLVRAATAALEEFGVGAPAARLLRGETRLHGAAEAAAANWQGAEAALLFSSGFMANQALITAIAGAGDLIVSDALNHASLIDAMRLSRARREVVAHGDLAAVEAALTAGSGARRRYIVVEEVYSMAGDRAPLEALLDIAERRDAGLIVDRAHAAGLLDELRPWPRRLVATMLTGGKALGVGGAFVCGSRSLRELLVNRARAFIYTTAVPPAMAAALGAAITQVRAEPERGGQALAAARRLRLALAAGGIEALGDAAIVPVLIGAPERAVAVAAALQAEGYDIRAVRPPTVPEGRSLLRVVCHADHTDDEIDALAEALLVAVKVASEPDVACAAALGGSVVEARAWVLAPRTLVVCGTDTEVGKTVVSALLMRAARSGGERALYLKPLQTGADSDTGTVRELAGLEALDAPPPVVELARPASVDQAAAAEGRQVTLAEVLEGIAARQGLAPDARWLLECAGGLRVPLNDQEDQLALLARLGAPVVLVARSALGTLNHTLLSVDALRARGLRLCGLFLVGERHRDNERSLAVRIECPIYPLPRFASLDAVALDGWLAGRELEELWK